MSVEPHELSCDSPPYDVVQACQSVYLSPEDVRWCRLDPGLEYALMFPHAWKLLMKLRKVASCQACAQSCPALQRCVFDRGDEEVAFIMGQCQRCRAIYWRPD